MIQSCDRYPLTDSSPTFMHLVRFSWTPIIPDWPSMLHIIGMDCTCPWLTVVQGDFLFGVRSERNSRHHCRRAEGDFLKHRPVEEVMDNGVPFRSEILRETLDKLNIRWYYKAAYRPSGNRIVERNHRTIKAITKRGSISPAEAVFWYSILSRPGNLRKPYRKERSLITIGGIRKLNQLPSEQTCLNPRIGEEV